MHCNTLRINCQLLQNCKSWSVTMVTSISAGGGGDSQSLEQHWGSETAELCGTRSAEVCRRVKCLSWVWNANKDGFQGLAYLTDMESSGSVRAPAWKGKVELDRGHLTLSSGLHTFTLGPAHHIGTHTFTMSRWESNQWALLTLGEQSTTVEGPQLLSVPLMKSKNPKSLRKF